MNKHGCSPTEDVCMEHERPLECRHGCSECGQHKCGGWGSLNNPDARGVHLRGKHPLPATKGSNKAGGR